MAPRVGIVLSGGGARGAYEAGALSVVLPALADLGQRPTLFVGTSVGAINAAYLAASRHRPPREAAAGLLERWGAVDKGGVVRPILFRQAPLTALRYAGELLSLPGVRLASLLDPQPLERNLRRWIDWPALHSNVGAGLVQAVGTDAVTEPSHEPGRHDCRPPDFGDGALHALQGALVDPLVEDVRMLGNVNAFYADGAGAPAARRYREARGKPPYRRIPYLFVAPPRRGPSDSWPPRSSAAVTAGCVACAHRTSRCSTACSAGKARPMASC